MGVRIDYLLGQGQPWDEEQSLGPNQTAVTLVHTYKPGSGRLSAYLNGVFLYRDSDYSETSPNRIDLLCSVKSGDRMFFVHS